MDLKYSDNTMNFSKLMLALFLLVWNGLVFASGTNPVVRLESGDFAVYLKDGDRGLQYKIGLVDDISNDPLWHGFSLGEAEGKPLISDDFNVESIAASERNGIRTVTCMLHHKRMPLSITKIYTAYASTGVISQKCTLKNTGQDPVHLSRVPSLHSDFAGNNFEYSYLTTAWSDERHLKTEVLNKDSVGFESRSGRSSSSFSPWICMHNPDKDIYYIAQLAWSGNWFLNLLRSSEKTVSLVMGEYFDNGYLVLMPGKSLELPEAMMSAAYSYMDDAANNLHHYQRDFVIRKEPGWQSMPVQFNSWFPLQQTITAENLIPYVDKAAELGCEVFTIDAGWFTRKTWFQDAGDWTTNQTTFPGGMGVIADYIRSRNMKFGIWFDLECLGNESDMFRLHPDWCLQYDGKPVLDVGRSHLDYSKPEVFQWALDQFARLYEECHGIDWVKLDYNISIGSGFENEAGIKTGDRLRNHIRSYYQWLDTLHMRYPDLFIENCSSGGLRLDLGVMAHTHASFISDETSPDPSLGMAWSSTLEYIPRALNHWVVGMGNHYAVIDQSLPEGYWDFMFKIPMNGQFGISSKVIDWSPELEQCALKNVALFKRIRGVIANADCYHLTPQPDYRNPEGWMALQYVGPDRKNSVATVYRMNSNDSRFIAKLRGLDSGRRYKITIDGISQGSMSGKDLMQKGLEITLKDKFRASVLIIES